MTSFIPYQYIEEIFKSKRVHLDAIMLALPTSPILVHTPKLLSIMTGKKWETFIVSHRLIQIWVATLFYIRTTQQESSWSKRIEIDLKLEQQHIYENSIGNAFTIQYINAYEKAIIKYLHVFKVGTEGAKSEEGVPPVTEYIMRMTHMKEFGFDTIITSEIFKGESKHLDDFTVLYDQDKNQVL